MYSPGLGDMSPPLVLRAIPQAVANMTRRIALSFAAVVAVATFVAACTDSGSPIAPNRSSPPIRFDVSSDSSSVTVVASDTIPTVSLSSSVPAPTQLLYCPTTDQASARATIGAAGGSVGARGTVLTLPAGAVDAPTEFEVVVPASDYLEVQVHAVGHASFQFLKPVYISLNFARCSSLPAEKLQAVYIDATRSIVELMGAGADRVNKKLVFTTPHLSGYAIAWGTDTTTVQQ
jgi:hypothetical protein